MAHTAEQATAIIGARYARTTGVAPAREHVGGGMHVNVVKGDDGRVTVFHGEGVAQYGSMEDWRDGADPIRADGGGSWEILATARAWTLDAPDPRLTVTGDARPARFIVTDYPRGIMLPARVRVVVADTFVHALSVADGGGDDVVYAAPTSGTVVAANRGAYRHFASAVTETPAERVRHGMSPDGPADIVAAPVTGTDR